MRDVTVFPNNDRPDVDPSKMVDEHTGTNVSARIDLDADRNPQKSERDKREG